MRNSYLQALIDLAFSKTARNSYFIFIGNLLSMIFAFLFTYLIVRALSLSDMGYFSALWSFLLLISDISDFGIGTSLARFLPTMESNKKALFTFFKTAFTVQLTATLILMVVIIIFSSYLSEILFHDVTLGGYFIIISFGIFGSILGNFFLNSLLARQRFVTASFYTVAGGVLRLTLLLIVIVFSTVSLLYTVWAQVLSLIGFALTGFFFVGPGFLRFPISKHDAKELIAFSKYVAAARGLTAIAGKLDVLMIIALTNSVEAGIYAVASRVVSIYPMMSGSFSTVIAPKIASLSDKPKELKRFFFNVTIATLCIISTIIVLIPFSDLFLSTLFQEKGHIAAHVFQILLVGMIFFVASLPTVSCVLYYLHKPHILTINSMLQLCTVIIGNLYFIPRFGGVGAAYSLIAAYGISFITTTCMAYYYLRKKHG